MTLEMRPDPKLIRASIAMVWLYEGLWCKLLGGVPRHADVIAAAPFIGPGSARAALITLGLAPNAVSPRGSCLGSERARRP
jgi:DoxX-like family